MTQDELQRLRQLPIEEVAERLGLEVVRGHRCLCPFHNDQHPSLQFYPQQNKNNYHCFVCGAHGDGIRLVMDYLHKTFPEATAWLGAGALAPRSVEKGSKSSNSDERSTLRTSLNPSNLSNYARFFQKPWLSDLAKDFLFNKRRLSPEVVAWLRLATYRHKDGTEWLQIPYFDIDGKTLLAVQSRNLMPNPQPRFRFLAGQQAMVYNLPILATLQPQEPLFITEGCSDCWAMLSLGRKAIAIPSATLLTKENKALLQRLVDERQTPLHMYPDNDVPGELLFLQLQQLLPNLQRHPLPPGCKDLAEAYLKKLAISNEQ